MENCTAVDAALLVGDARETESEHRRRHPAGRDWASSCPRCEYYKHRVVWEEVARTRGPRSRPRVAGETSWLVQKPSFLGGPWGLGCCLCAAGCASGSLRRRRSAIQKAYAKDGIQHQRVCRMNTKFARYEHRVHRKSTMVGDIEAHASSQLHKLVRDNMIAPAEHLALAPLLPDPESAACGADPESTACGADPESAACGARGKELATIAELFKGRVPQLQEWVDAWADCSSAVSFLKQEEISRKRHKVHHTRRHIGKMALVMGEVARMRARKTLKAATSITIALDESKTRKVLRFCCDTPTPPYVAHGLIGTLRLSYEQPDAGCLQQQMEEDHAVHALRALTQCLTKFCTRVTRRQRRRATRVAVAARGAEVFCLFV